jgi:hypothetical protein
MDYNLEERTKKFSKEKEYLKKLWKEAHELTLIFNKISSSLRK